MFKGINLSETVDYVSPNDKGEPKTIAKLGALDGDVFDFVVSREHPLKIAAEAVRFGLKGLENFKDGNGNLVKFDTVSRAFSNGYNYKVVSDNIMKILPPELKSEWAAEILKISKLSEEEQKN